MNISVDHLIPLYDLAPHSRYEEYPCWCEPWTVSNGTVVHNSADGREYTIRKEPYITGFVEIVPY